jgi:hypothetical protein
MPKEKLSQLEKEMDKIKQELMTIGEMRPGSLTCQYRIPKNKIGPFYQISYTYKMKSHTEYVRPEFFALTKQQITNYKRFRELVKKWVDLAIKHAKLKIKLAKK